MKKILITGCAGNIGSALSEKLSKSGKYKVFGIDNLSTGSVSKLPVNLNFNFIKGDVNDYNEISSLFYSNSFEYVFHFAAVVGVRRTLDNPLLVLADIDGIRNILKLSKNCFVKKVFFSSSSEVYGEPVFLPQHEDLTPLNSKLPYAIVKNIGESYFKSYFLEHNLAYTIFRFFNTYGPNQSDDFVVPRFLRLALNNEPITIYGDGKQTRTFCYIDDNIDTIVKCLEDEKFENDVLNIGSDIECSVLDLAKIVIRQTSSNSKIIHLPPLPEGDMTRRQPDIFKMKSILDRKLITIEEGINKLLAFNQKL
jgi:UDP-glucose 4-epimerase